MSALTSPPGAPGRRCGLALGSNLGDRIQWLQWAVLQLESRFGPAVRSPLYETAPVGCPEGSGMYVNGVIEITTDLEPLPLLRICQQLETEAGRVRTGLYGEARPLDIDILYMGCLQCRQEELTVPHPRAHLRRFVLRPLADIRPDLVLPGQTATARELLVNLLTDEPEPVLLLSSFPSTMTPHPFLSRIRELRGVRPITMLTAYDYPTARLLDETGVDMILVGDSLGMVVLGFPDTTHVTLEHMLHHAEAVVRGARNALVIVDMPIHTYDTPEQALATARRLMGTGAAAVKLEGGREKAEHIAAITRAGIPVMAHIGLLPQKVLEEGGYKQKGKSEAEAEAMLADIRAVAEAGAFAAVVECTKGATAARITHSSPIPTIGIGSGRGNCDGEVAVIHDLVGAFPWFVPSFVTQRAHIAADIAHAVSEWSQSLALPSQGATA